jgi:hypothetical protein
MSTPGFPPGTLDSEGEPSWLVELACEDPNHTLHVVKNLEPAEALERLGANPRLFRSCELPATRPDAQTSLPGAALDIEPGGSAALLAGRIGEWTFVYDDAGYTFPEDHTIPLSASVFDIEGAEHGEADYAIGMRVVCAMAGLTCTLGDLRSIPLLGTPFG